MSDSSHVRRLLHVRPPRVRITYAVETGGALEQKELPFIVGILADLTGYADVKTELKDREFFDIDRDNFNDVMKPLAPCVKLDAIRAANPVLQQILTPADYLITFSTLQDFDPVHIVKSLPSLNTLYQLRTRLKKVQANAEAGSTDYTHIDNLLATNALNGALREIAPDISLTDAQMSAMCAAVAVSAGSTTVIAIDALVTYIDHQLSAALSVILHARPFQQLEATWHGLHYLVSNTETGPLLKLRVLNATKDELQANLAKVAEFDQSALFKMVYEAEYGTYGGLPYSLLIGAYEITHEQADIDFITRISQVAAAAHAPFITAASHELFSLPGFDKLNRPRVLSKLFEGIELVGWQQFRDTEDARYVTLVLPRVLMRLPYGKPETSNTTQCEGFNFEEILSLQQTDVVTSGQTQQDNPQPAHENFLWGNAAFLLAERITNAFALYGWTAAIRGLDGGGLVQNLSIYSYASQSDTSNLVGPTEIPIRAGREQELNDLGFTPLCHSDKTVVTSFFNGQTTNRPKRYISDEADTNARLSSTLPYILSASRFAHYIKVIMRNRVGSFLTRENIEGYLNSWIANYVLLDDNASQDVKAAYPLRAASIAVTEIPGEPGAYNATLFVRPHFQLEELTVSIRLVVKLSA